MKVCCVYNLYGDDLESKLPFNCTQKHPRVSIFILPCVVHPRQQHPGLLQLGHIYGGSKEDLRVLTGTHQWPEWAHTGICSLALLHEEMQGCRLSAKVHGKTQNKSAWRTLLRMSDWWCLQTQSAAGRRILMWQGCCRRRRSQAPYRRWGSRPASTRPLGPTARSWRPCLSSCWMRLEVRCRAVIGGSQTNLLHQWQQRSTSSC